MGELTGDSPESDETLLAAIARGDHRAFTRLVERHADAIHGYVLRMTGSRADAEDHTQETFLRVWRRAETFAPGRVKASTWLHRIAHNLTVDGLRRPRELPQAIEDPEGTGGVSTFEIHAAREAVARLEGALAKLPSEQRAALLLCRVQGFSNTEAGEILGLGVRAVESLVARARRRLRRELSEEGDDS